MYRPLPSFFKRTPEPTSDFSAFFIHATAREKKRLIQAAVRKANEDQQDLIRRAQRGLP
jgi:hypothetical protein